MIQQIHSWIFIWREWKYQFKKHIHSYVHYSIIYDSQDLKTM